jgi:hypothetical protein
MPSKQLDESIHQEHDVRLEDTRKFASNKLKTVWDRSNSGLKKLDELHERTNVQESLRLSQGQRLKLDEKHLDNSALRRDKPAPNFDIAFTALQDAERPPSPHGHVGYESDELPDVKTLLQGNAPQAIIENEQTPLSETTYSSSELNSMIRAMPSSDLDLDKLEDVRLKAANTVQNPCQFGGAIIVSNMSPLAPQRSKRGRDDHQVAHTPEPKRVRRDEFRARQNQSYVDITVSNPGLHLLTEKHSSVGSTTASA